MYLSKELQEPAPGRRRSVEMPIGQRETQTLLDSSPPTVPWLLLFLCANVLHKSTSIPQESFAGCQLSNQPPLFKMYFELCGGVCGLWHVHDSASEGGGRGVRPRHWGLWAAWWWSEDAVLTTGKLWTGNNKVESGGNHSLPGRAGSSCFKSTH